MLLKLIRALFHPALTSRRQAAELQGMSARELNDLGIGRGEIPYWLLPRAPGCGERIVKVGSRSGVVIEWSALDPAPPTVTRVSGCSMFNVEAEPRTAPCRRESARATG